MKRAVSFPADTHRDVGGRGWHGGARRSHRGARDGLLAAGSGLSVQESQLRYFNFSYQMNHNFLVCFWF